MSIESDPSTRRYDGAAPRWGDKMRTLGYADAYLWLLAQDRDRVGRAGHVLDIGAGTAAFSEAWVTLHGVPDALTLLDPSAGMLDRAVAALARLGVTARRAQGPIGKVAVPTADVALAAHVLEHCNDPAEALGQIARSLRPGGRLYLVVSKPHWCNAIIWLQWRHRTFGRDEITGLLRASGFDVGRIHAFPSGPPSRTSLAVVATRVG